MTRPSAARVADPQRTTGTPYRQPGPPCVCGEPEAVHEVLDDDSRGPCRAGYPAGPSTCRRYQPAGGAQ